MNVKIVEQVHGDQREEAWTLYSEAFAELQRFSGTQFDPVCVEALLAAIPSADDIEEPALAQLLGRQLVTHH